MIDFAGFIAPFVIYAYVLALHLVLPAQEVRGYVRDASDTPLSYRLNGLPVAFTTLATWAFVCGRGWIAWDFLWIHRWGSLAGACAIGLVVSVVMFVTAPSTGAGALREFYLGRRANPQAMGGRLDTKMFLYLVGATMLALNLGSFAAHHIAAHPGNPSPGVLLHCALFGWFLVDYLFFERVHLYTYDLFAERVGFKLGWGCLSFYPYFYAVGLWSIADRPNPHTSVLGLVLAAVVFFAGWCLARGANMQKFFFKLDPRAPFLGIAPQVVSDGSRALLCSGFWGVARHVNYLGEVLMATGLALALGHPGAIGPWLYPLYYVALLVPRERDDHRRCAAKYGALWDEYCRRVRYRIIPGVY